MGKSWDQFWHFDDDAYAADVAKLTPEQLTELHGIINRRVISAGTGIGFGILTVPTTGGLSLAASGVAGRQTVVNRRRLKIIEKRIEEVQAERYKVRKRDYAIPIAVSACGVGLATGLEPVFQDVLVEPVAVNAAKVVTEMAAEPTYEYVHDKASSKVPTVKANGSIIPPKAVSPKKGKDFKVRSVRKVDLPAHIAALLPPDDSRPRSKSVSSNPRAVTRKPLSHSIRPVASNPSLPRSISPPPSPPSPLSSTKSSRYPSSLAPPNIHSSVSATDRKFGSKQLPPLPPRYSSAASRDNTRSGLRETEASRLGYSYHGTSSEKVAQSTISSKNVRAPPAEVSAEFIRKLTDDIESYLKEYTGGPVSTYEFSITHGDQLMLYGGNKKEAVVAIKSEGLDSTGTNERFANYHNANYESEKYPVHHFYNIPSAHDLAEFPTSSTDHGGFAVPRRRAAAIA